MASCKDCKFPCAYRGADDDYSNKDRPACAGAHLEAMKAARSEDRASRYDVTLLQSFEWEGDVLIRTLAERIGEDSDIHVLDHYQTDFTELREFLDAKRKGLELRPVVRCRDCKHNEGAKVWRFLDLEDTLADCSAGHGYPPMDWFCADGVRREES